MTKNAKLETIPVSQIELIREACRAALEKNPILTTDELKTHCRLSGAFREELYFHAKDAKETAAINQALGTLKNEIGDRLVHSVQLANPVTGETTRHHYQESLFDLSHYTSFIPKVAFEGRTKTKKAKTLNENCKRKFKVDVGRQLPFDFDAVCDAFGLQEKAAKK